MRNAYWDYNKESDTIQVTERHAYWFSVQDVKNCKKGEHDILRQLSSKLWFTESHFWYLIKLCKALCIDIDYEWYAVEYGKSLKKREVFEECEYYIERLKRAKELKDKKRD